MLEPPEKRIYEGWYRHNGKVYLTSKENWPQHKYHLRLFRVLWGTTPPRDILNLAKNEGLNYQKNLDLMFTSESAVDATGTHVWMGTDRVYSTAAPDLRSVMTTVNGLPSNYQGKCNVIVNEADKLLTFRNMLILILAHGNTGGILTDTIVHLWYSASLTLACYKNTIFAWMRIKELFKSLLDNPKVQTATVPYSTNTTKSTMFLTLNPEQLKAFCELFDADRMMHRAENNRRLSMGDCDPELVGLFSDPFAKLLEESWFRSIGSHVPPVPTLKTAPRLLDSLNGRLFVRLIR